MSGFIPAGEVRGIYGFPGARRLLWMAFREVRIRNLGPIDFDVRAELDESGVLEIIVERPGATPLSAPARAGDQRNRDTT